MRKLGSGRRAGRAAALCAAAMVAAPCPPVMGQLPVPTAASGEKLFRQQCAVCHSLKAGEARVGPSLAGLLERRAGLAPGFNYSPTLKRSGIVWQAKSLDRWLTDSNATVPGSVMNYQQPDIAKRQLIVRYLLSALSPTSKQEAR